MFRFVLALLALQLVHASLKERWETFKEDYFPSLDFSAMALDSNGNRWFGTDRGLAFLSQGLSWEQFTQSSTGGSLPSDTIRCIEVDPFGDVWIGTSGGLVKYVKGSWEVYTAENTREGLPSSNIYSIHIVDADTRWIGTDKGFAELKGSIWTTYTGQKISGIIQIPTITALQWEGKSKLWIGTPAGLFQLDRNVITQKFQNLPQKLHNQYITRLTLSSEGNLWIGTQNGYSIWAKNNLENFPMGSREHVLGDIVYDIRQGFGDVWIGYKGGLARFSDGTWQTWDRSKSDGGLLSIRVHTLLPEKKGEVWIGTRQGISKLYLTPKN